MAGWEPGKLDSVDKFAQACVDYASDNDAFVLALGELYEVTPSMNAVQALMKILGTIADEVCDEVAEKWPEPELIPEQDSEEEPEEEPSDDGE